MFKGFNFKLPSYTVITPQTGQTFEVRSMTVAEVNEMKTSLVTPNRAHVLVNDVLFKCLQTKPDEITDPMTFKKNVTTQDRESLLYGLYHVTFGENREFQVVCSNCGAEQLLKVQLSKAFSMNAYPKSDAVKKSYAIAKACDDADPDPEIEQAIAESAISVEDTTMDIPKGINPVVPPELQKTQNVGPIGQEDGDDGIGLGRQPAPKSAKPPVTTNRPGHKPPPGVPLMDEDARQQARAQALQPPAQTQHVDAEVQSILTERKSVELPISKVVCIIRQPTVFDEEKVLKDLSFLSKKHGDLVNETLIIERFEQYREGDKSPTTLVMEREDIFVGYQSLPPQDKVKILEEYQEIFGQYGIEVKTTYDCNKCGFENDLDINVAAQFFRMVSLS